MYNCTDYDMLSDCGEALEREISDKIVNARKIHQCEHCNGVISKKEKYRKLVAIVEGNLTSFKWCKLCCDAMVKELEMLDGIDYDGQETPLSKRLNLHGEVYVK